MENGQRAVHAESARNRRRVNRGPFNRKVLTEFGMRVVFQMSANDSASLIDSPAAGNPGLHRARFHNEHESLIPVPPAMG